MAAPVQAVGGGFQWDREVPPDWQARLEQLTPRSEQISWLWLQWYPGWPYEPVQRWAIYEILPVAQVQGALDVMRQRGFVDSPIQMQWAQLTDGPDPRTAGAFYERNGVKRFRGRQLVSHPQWQAHKATGGLPVLVWIIEGHHGGHSWQFGPFEQALFELGGLSSAEVTTLMESLPRPGDEPYADFDDRVLQALATRDRLYRMAGDWGQRVRRADAGHLLEHEEAEARITFGKEWMRWVENQISALVSDVPRTQIGKFMEATRPEWEPTRAEESLTEELITGAPDDRNT